MVKEREDEKAKEGSKILVHIKRDDDERNTGSAECESKPVSLEVEVLPPARDDEARNETKVRVIIKAIDNFGYANGENTNENETQ